MSKIKFNKLPLVYPIPSVLIGTVINNKPNFTTIENYGIINLNPAVIYISMEKNHYTNKGIRENQNYAFLLLPYLSKFFLKALSVGNIEATKTTH